MGWYERLRPLFFAVPAEVAHSAGLRLMQWVGSSPARRSRSRRRWGFVEDPVDLCGIRFPNRVGLAAGYDKDGIGWAGLATLGFGHLELGTVTPEPQPGNPRPRVFRLPADRGLVNRLGFPSRGADQLVSRLAATGKKVERSEGRGPVLGINLGKQKETALSRAADDYCRLVGSLAPWADYLVVNVSSPNTPDLRRLQTPRFLRQLLESVRRERDRQAATLERPLPLWVKIAPDLEVAELGSLVDTVLEAGIDGLVATNTTVDREGLRSPRSRESGGLSGAPLAARSLAVLESVAERTGGALPLVAVGGILDGAGARARIDAGADLVQLYTGLVYRGPRLVKEVAQAVKGSRESLYSSGT